MSDAMNTVKQEAKVSAEQAAVEERLTRNVLASFANTKDPRLKQVMESLVTHLHTFIRDVRLTEAEWNKAIEYLTAVGHITDDRRQEFILLSDVLGASMQTINVNNEAYKDAPEATVFGPFFVDDAPEIPIGGDIAGGAPGQPCWVEGSVRDTDPADVAQELRLVVAVEVDLVVNTVCGVAGLELVDDVRLARDGAQCGYPVVVAHDLVADRARLDRGRPADDARDAEGALPVGVLLGAEPGYGAIGPGIHVGTVVTGINNDSVIGNTHVIECL